MTPKRSLSKARNSPCEQKYAEAESRQQRAERRNDVSLYEKAAQAFAESIQLASCSLSSSQRSAENAILRKLLNDAHFGLAETLQSWGELILENVNNLSDGELTIDVEIEATRRACGLFSDAVEKYLHVVQMNDDSAGSGIETANKIGDNRVGSSPSMLRVDAAVNCGNTYAAWAEALSSLMERDNFHSTKTEIQLPKSLGPRELFQMAEDCYLQALGKEEDAMTWSNLADALVQHGEVLCRTGEMTEGFKIFERAHDAYGKSCGLSSSENGDDLPGLLLNWGCGLMTAAEFAVERSKALLLIDEAATRLQESISFGRGDPAPHCALGDVLLLKSEWLRKSNESFHEAAISVQKALSEGYEAALRIQATYPDALIGIADAKSEAARCCEAVGNTEESMLMWQEAANAFEVALSRVSSKLGGFTERNDAKYNYACALAKSHRVNESIAILRSLGNIGGLDLKNAAQDADLAILHEHNFFSSTDNKRNA